MKYLNISKHIIFSISLLFIWQPLVLQEVIAQEITYRDSILKYYHTDTLKFKKFVDDYILKAKKDKNPKELFSSYHALSSYYFERNDTLKYIESTDSLFTVAKENNLDIELLKGFHLKNNYLVMKFGLNDPRIFDNISEALKIAKQIDNKVWQCKFINDLAVYYKLLGEFKPAIDYYKQNLSILKGVAKSKDYKQFNIWGSSLESTYLELSEIYITLKEIDSAKIYNHLTKSILDTTNGPYHDVKSFRNKIQELEINLLEDKIRLAKTNLNEAFDILPSTNKKTFKPYFKNYYSGMISYHEGNYGKAINNLEAIDTILIKTTESQGFLHKDLYKMLYKSYLKTRDINKADFYFEKHLSSLKGQMDINNAINSNFKKIETDGYLEEMKILKNENTKQRVIFLIGFIAAIIMLFFIVLGFKGNQKRNQEKLKIPIDQISIQEKRHQPKVDVLKINDTEIQRIIQNLNELEDKGYFLRVDCTVSNLAKKLKTNTTYLSKIVNVHYQKNFTTYINDQRIDYVRERLKKDPMFRRYSIVSIANEIGFKSKESFNSAFKKRTGVLPSVVIKELNKTLNS